MSFGFTRFESAGINMICPLAGQAPKLLDVSLQLALRVNADCAGFGQIII